MPRPDATHLIAELKRHGVTEYRTAMGATHPRLFFHWQGREMFCVFPVSPSDWRASRNAVCNLRRLMGVRRVPAKKRDRV